MQKLTKKYLKNIFFSILESRLALFADANEFFLSVFAYQNNNNNRNENRDAFNPPRIVLRVVHAA